MKPKDYRKEFGLENKGRKRLWEQFTQDWGALLKTHGRAGKTPNKFKNCLAETRRKLHAIFNKTKLSKEDYREWRQWLVDNVVAEAKTWGYTGPELRDPGSYVKKMRHDLEANIAKAMRRTWNLSEFNDLVHKSRQGFLALFQRLPEYDPFMDIFYGEHVMPLRSKYFPSKYPPRGTPKPKSQKRSGRHGRKKPTNPENSSKSA